MKRIAFGLSVLIVLAGCSTTTLSQRAQQQNIKTATSQDMVEDMTHVHDYSANFDATLSIEEVAISAANKAADDGYSNMTVLVTLVSEGVFMVLLGGAPLMVPSTYEISYWE